MRDILVPELLATRVVSRAALKKAFVKFDPHYDELKVGYHLRLVSSQLGMKKRAFSGKWSPQAIHVTVGKTTTSRSARSVGLSWARSWQS